MSTLTPNYGLIVPEGTDTVEQVRADYATNLNTIDGIGGGGSGGHTIVNENGTDMPAEGKLQFTGNVSVTDDSGNGKTVVDILGGGGNVYGAFIDTNRIIQAQTAIPANTTATYTATEDCYLLAILRKNGDASSLVYVDGEQIGGIYTSTGYTTDLQGFFIKKGQVVTITVTSESHYTVYGLTQGTSGIFTPIIYSDTERVVGVWRDNKPLYQRTWDLGSDVLINSNTWTNTSISVADVNFEKIVGSQGTNSGGTTFGFIGANRDQTYVQILQTRNSAISIRYLTLLYTKTTDVAGSGNWNTDGVPTVHYSTSEQVIGTWIDGKPLYEKTIHVANSQGSFSDYVTIETMTDLKMSVSADFTARRYIAGTGEWFISGNGMARAEQNDTYYIGVRVFNQNLQYVIGGYGTQITDLWITVRYTKTTD